MFKPRVSLNCEKIISTSIFQINCISHLQYNIKYGRKNNVSQPHKNVHVQILRTCEYDRLYGKDERRLHMELRLLILK